MLEYLQNIFENRLVVTVVVIVIPLLVRYFALRQVRQKDVFLSDSQRRWMSAIKYISWIMIMLGLLILWWPELQKFALSIAAVAVALVIATKELILCLSGNVLRASSGSFSVGDWIEVGQIRGEVIDQTLVITVVQEIDMANNNYDYTGKTISIPNSIFLSQPVKNMNFMKHYVYHSVSITTEPVINSFELKEFILEKIKQYSEEFSEIAKRYNSLIEYRTGIDLPGPEPTVRVTTSEVGKNIFTVVFFCPTGEAVLLEQKICNDFMNYFYEKHEQWLSHSPGKA